MKKKNKSRITAAEFDKKFDDGQDVTGHLDLKSAQVRRGIQRVNMDMPQEMLKKVDAEAARVGVTRTSLIKLWIAERVDRLAS